jgi:hypothetical protein
MKTKRYTFADADQFGLPPNAKCDYCGGKFKTAPIVDQSRSGFYRRYCSKSCADKGLERGGVAGDHSRRG